MSGSGGTDDSPRSSAGTPEQRSSAAPEPRSTAANPEQVSGAAGEDVPYVPFATIKSRQHFISRVFSVVLAMLSLIAFGAFFPFFFPNVEQKDDNGKILSKAHGLRNFFIEHWYLVFIPMIFWIVTYILLIWCDAVRKATPCNLVTLSIFSVSAALMMPFATAPGSFSGVAVAFIVTAALSLAIIIMAKFTSIDFTACGFMIWLVSIGVCLFALTCTVFICVARPPMGVSLIVHMVLSLVYIVMYCVYLARDIQLVLGGRRHEITEDQWIFGAVIIFTDIYGLLWTMIGVFR